MNDESRAPFEAVDEVTKLLRHHDADPLLVGVSGCGSLREPVAAALAAELDAVVVDLADFRRPMDSQRAESLDAQSAYELVDDWQRLVREVLDPLLLGQVGAYRRYDAAAGRLGDDACLVEPRGAVVVSGAFVLRPQLRGYWDIAVHAACEPTTEAERWFVENVVPGGAADVVVPLSP